MPTARYSHSCGIVDSYGKEIVVVGGDDGTENGRLDSVDIFNLETMKWRRAG